MQDLQRKWIFFLREIASPVMQRHSTQLKKSAAQFRTIPRNGVPIVNPTYVLP